MLTIHADRLVLDIPCEAENPVETYFQTLRALTDILWFTLENPTAQEAIGKDAALVAYNLLKPMLTVDEETRTRMLIQ